MHNRHICFNKFENQSILICNIYFTGFNGKQYRNEVRWHSHYLTEKRVSRILNWMMSSCKNKLKKSNVSLLISYQLSWFILYLSFVITSAPRLSFLLVFCVVIDKHIVSASLKKNWPSFHLCTPNFFFSFFLLLIINNNAINHHCNFFRL